MPKFWIYDGDSLVNFIIADSKEIAEEVTGLTAVEHSSENTQSVSGV